MEKYSEVVGRSVICINNGKKVGIIKDIAFTPKTREVVAFIMARKGYEISKRAILLKDVLNFGDDVIVINDDSCVRAMNKIENYKELKEKEVIKGLRVYTKKGEDLGIVEDVLFDSSTGIVEGVEVSDGLLQDIAQGRNILPLFGRVEFSNEFILVDKEAVDEIMPSGGGLKKFFK